MKTFIARRGNTRTESETLLDVEVMDYNYIVLYNDDVNTFDHVIETLIEVCNHQPEQAEQCAYIVHFNGKCTVKKGIETELEPLCLEMLRRGLSAKIE